MRLLPATCTQLLESVIEVVELRGAQAGGVNTFITSRSNKFREEAIDFKKLTSSTVALRGWVFSIVVLPF